MKDVYVVEEKESINFGNGKIKLTFSKKTGGWINLFDVAKGISLFKEEEELEPALIYVDGKWKGKKSKYLSHSTETTEDKVKLIIKTKIKDWIMESSYLLISEDDLIEKKLKITYTGTKRSILEGVNFALPRIKIGDINDCFLMTPGCSNQPRLPLSNLKNITGGFSPRQVENMKKRGSLYYPDYFYKGQKDELIFFHWFPPANAPGLFVINNYRYELSLMVWGYSETEAFFPRLNSEKDGTLQITHNLIIGERFTQNKSLECDSLFVKIARDSVKKALKSFQNWYKSIGLSVYDKNNIKTRRGAKIFQVFPYEIGFKGILDLLPRLKEMKINIIYLMPIWAPRLGYKDYKVDWGDHYFWDDCSRLDSRLGTKKDFKKLVNEAHRLGMKVLIDFVIQGCFVKSKLVEKYPQWFCLDKKRRMFGAHGWGQYVDINFLPPGLRIWWDGSSKRKFPPGKQKEEIMLYKEYWGLEGDIISIGTFSLDWANEDYQEYMTKIAEYYVKEYGIDGYRIDAPWWKEYNWDPKISYRPSYTTLGGVKLTEKIRKALDKIKPGIFTFPEADGPIFYRMNDLTYDYHLYFSIRLLLEKRITAKELSEWLEYEKLAFPKGAVKMRFTETHDTVLQPEAAPNIIQIKYGISASRAAFALVAFIEGAVLACHFQVENPCPNGVGIPGKTKIGVNLSKFHKQISYEGALHFYKKILSLRTFIPALDYGDCNYTCVNSSDEMVFTCLRSEKGEYAIPVINFRAENTTTLLNLPFEKMNLKSGKSYILYDVYNNEEIKFSFEKCERIKLRLEGFGIRVLVLKKGSK